MSENMMIEQKNYSLGMTEVEARQVAEIKGKMVLARQFPRDPNQALQRILRECENEKLAEVAVYSFPRGDSEVRGPSVRLAEVIATHWGNFTCGVTELEQRYGESTVKAYAWDLESNFSDEKVFTVKHERYTKKKTYALTDQRDIYERVANDGARRKRACIFAVIPAYLVEEAMEACQKTLETAISKDGIEKAREKMLKAFMALDESLTVERLEEKIGKPFDKFGNKDIVKLRNLYAAIKDGFVKLKIAFGMESENVPMASTVDVDIVADAARDIFGTQAEGQTQGIEAETEEKEEMEPTFSEEEIAEIKAKEEAEAASEQEVQSE